MSLSSIARFISCILPAGASVRPTAGASVRLTAGASVRLCLSLLLPIARAGANIRLCLLLIIPVISMAQNFKKADSLFAAARYDDAIVQYRELRTISLKDKKSEAEIAADLGIIKSLYWLGKFDEAQTEIAQSQQKLESKKLQKNIVAVKLFIQKGLVLQSLGKNDDAEKEFNAALSLLSSSVKSEQEEANVYNYLGVLNWNKGNNELALEHLNRALSIRQKLYANDNEEIAACYNDLGLVYASMGKTANAFNNYQEAKKIYEKVYGLQHPKTGLACNNLGIIAQKKGDYTEALAQFQNAINIYKGLYGDAHPNVAFVYATIGQLHQEREEYDEALDFFNRAIEIYQKVYGSRHPEIAVVHNQRALIYGAQGDFKKGLRSVQEALCANSPDFSNKNSSANPPVSSYYKSNLLLSSLLIKAQLLDQQYSNKTLKKENLVIALSTLRSCDTLIAKIRQLKSNKADKLELSSSSAQVYEEAIRICFTLSDVSLNKKVYHLQAFAFAEKGKAAILQEAISDVEAKHFANIPDSLLIKEKALKTAITLYEQKLAERKEPEKESYYKEQLFSANRRYEGFVKELEKQFPEYYELKYDVRAASVTEIQQYLQDGEAMLNYSISDSTHRLYVFYFDKKNFKALDLPLSPALFRNLKGLRNAIRFDDKEVLAQTSNDIYEALFGFRIPSNIKHLILIPEGRLGTLPYEALLTEKISLPYEYKDAPFLIKRYGISLQYSATLFVSTQKKKSSSAKGIFLCAPVDFSNFGINNLPGSQTEVETINEVMTKSGENTYLFMNQKACEATIKSNQLSACRLVHFATHGVVNEHKPELSQIFLSQDTTGGEDGHLFSGEIYNLHLQADLVTLSACQTGLGTVARGEGLIGLSRALIYAGARNLLLSLWTVSDASTSALMIDFYKRLEPSQTRFRDSIRQSKLEMIKEGKYSRPYYWAPFILIGN